MLTMTMMVDSLLTIIMMEIQRLSHAGQILPIQCGKAIWNTWQMGGQLTVMMIFLSSWLRVQEQ